MESRLAFVYPHLYDDASALYDGGWRSSDKEEIISEHGYTDSEADVICEFLSDFES